MADSLHSTKSPEQQPRPTYGNGKLCYLEIPSTDPERAAEFYQAVFGWNVRRRRDGHLAFDDAVGQVSGSWVKGRKPDVEAGILIYIMVDDIQATIAAITAKGGMITQRVGADHPEITARFADPDGNVFGLYQQPA